MALSRPDILQHGNSANALVDVALAVSVTVATVVAPGAWRTLVGEFVLEIAASDEGDQRESQKTSVDDFRHSRNS